jgi:hypothetical protein
MTKEAIKRVFTKKDGYYVSYYERYGIVRIYKDGFTIFRGYLLNIKDVNTLKDLCEGK